MRLASVPSATLDEKAWMPLAMSTWIAAFEQAARESSFTGTPGKYVKLEGTVKSDKRIVNGEFDELPEQAFTMRGGIEEVIEAAEKMKAQV